MKGTFYKVILTTHITSSVGWLGSVAAFLALAIAGMIHSNEQVVRSAYIAMQLTGWYVIVPLCFASLFSGLIESLTTRWGLFRHYWVVFKLLIAILATMVLLIHMKSIDDVAALAMQKALSVSDLRSIRIQLLADAGAALLVLLIAIVLSVFKPVGMTPYGKRKRTGLTPNTASMSTEASATGLDSVLPFWAKVILGLASAVILSFIFLHITGKGFGGHELH